MTPGHGQNCFLSAVSFNDLEALEYLHSVDANLCRAVDDTHHTALSLAKVSGNSEIVDYLTNTLHFDSSEMVNQQLDSTTSYNLCLYDCHYSYYENASANSTDLRPSSSDESTVLFGMTFLESAVYQNNLKAVKSIWRSEVVGSQGFSLPCSWGRKEFAKYATESWHGVWLVQS